MLGAGSILPSERRFSSGILLQYGKSNRILLDIGPGVIEKLRKLKIDLSEIKSVLITHLHVDHILDLPALIKIRAYLPRRTLKIYGPRGIGAWLDLILTDQRLFGYLSRLGCKEFLEVYECWKDARELEPGVKIYTTPVEHFNGIAYRLEFDDGTAITYSGDTSPDPRLVELARGSKVLIHECSFPAEKMRGKHTSDDDLVEIVREVQPEILIIVHLYPEMEPWVDRLRKKLKGVFSGEVYVPEDMSTIEV